jgi:hypothetical protein
LTIECPNGKNHRIRYISTDNDDRFNIYFCNTCDTITYEAVNSMSPDVIESPQIHDDYEMIERFQDDIDDEQMQTDLFCSEVERLW